MANTYIKIASVTVGSGGASNINFSSIPQTYTDLKLVISARSATSNWGDNPLISINGSTSTFTRRSIYDESQAVGSEIGSQGNMIGVITANSATANTFGVFEIYFANYTSSNSKAFAADSITENNATNAGMWLVAGLWSTSSAITQITLTTSSTANFTQYSSATLYGISKS